MPNTGLIVTIDLGEPRDIHPKNKLDVGKRMAYWALSSVYKQPTTNSGPTLESASPTASGAEMVLKFANVGKGLKVRGEGKLQEFAVAGADQKWYWAEAEIVGRDEVKVWSPQVPKPIAVRYAFNNNPKNPNLTNDSGLPASPFRTDNFPGPTDGKR